MKTELQAQQDFTEINELLKTLSQRLAMLRYDRCEVEICGNKVNTKLIETPGYKTIVHRFSQSGKYDRRVEV